MHAYSTYGLVAHYPAEGTKWARPYTYIQVWGADARPEIVWHVATGFASADVEVECLPVL